MSIAKTIGGNLTRDYFKTYYYRNREKILARQHEYIKNNKYKIAKYRNLNKQKMSNYQKEYSKLYPEKRRAITKRWYDNNRDKVAVKNKKYYENVTKLNTKKYTEELKQYQKDYYIKNLDRIKQRQKDYYNKIKERKGKKEKKKKSKKEIKITPTYNYDDDGMIILSFS